MTHVVVRLASRKVKPIRPNEVPAAKTSRIPDEVIAAFNELIVKNWDGSSATVLQSEALALIVAKLACLPDYPFEQGWMDIEDTFRKAGWSVEYDKPGYCETYEAHYTFTRKRLP